VIDRLRQGDSSSDRFAVLGVGEHSIEFGNNGCSIAFLGLEEQISMGFAVVFYFFEELNFVDFYAVRFVVGGEWRNYMRKLGGGYRNRFRLLRCARTRMTSLVDLFQFPNIQMAVNSRRRHVGVPEQLLDDPKITVVLKQVSCERMP
jgi:hypothetical protein